MVGSLNISQKQDLLLQKENENVDLDYFKNLKFGILGLGGVGSHTVEILVRSEISNFVLIDGDLVEESNLGRQNFEISDISKSKVKSIVNRLKKINSDLNIDKIETFLRKEEDFDVFGTCDIIIDCTDNLDTRRLLNSYCLRYKKMWVYSGGLGFESVVKIFDYSTNSDDSFSKLITEKHSKDVNCQDGVLNTTSQITACLIVNEILKYVCLGNKNILFVKFNSLHNQFYSLKLN